MLKTHRYLIGKIYLVAGLSLLLLTVCFYKFGFKPISDRLRAEHTLEIGHSLDSSLWLVQGILDKHKDLSAQIASRTAIRNKLIAYLHGETNLADLASFSAPKLAESMQANGDIIGISRFDPQGNLLFSVGEPLPQGVAERCGLDHLNALMMLKPLQIGSARRLIYCSPIMDKVAGHVGADILIMNEDDVQDVIDTSGSGVVREMAISVVVDDRILYWPAALTGSPLQKVLDKFLKSGVTEAGYIIRSKDTQQHGWQLYAVVDQKQFFADINRYLFTVLGVIAFVAALLFALTVAVLQPIIRALLKEQKLIELSNHDGLTGLYNHAHMQELLSNELARSKRYRRPLSVLMIDIDHFKAVNDTYGHPVGDDVLRSLSQRLQLVARTQDIAARYGGEEFMLILPETGPEAAAVVAERLRADIASMRLMAEGHEFMVTISIGLVTYDAGANEVTQRDIVEAADKALYASKSGGRNRVTADILAAQAHDQAHPQPEK